MKSDYARKHLSDGQTRISDLWGMVTCYHMAFADYLVARERVFSRLPKTVPGWVRDQLRAYERAYYDIHTRKMAYAHAWDGLAYFSWDTLPEAGKQAFRDGKGVSAHVWPTPDAKNGAPIPSLRAWGEWKH